MPIDADNEDDEEQLTALSQTWSCAGLWSAVWDCLSSSVAAVSIIGSRLLSRLPKDAVLEYRKARPAASRANTVCQSSLCPSVRFAPLTALFVRRVFCVALRLTCVRDARHDSQTSRRRAGPLALPIAAHQGRRRIPRSPSARQSRAPCPAARSLRGSGD